MKLLYYCWDSDGIHGSFPQIFNEKPADVEVDESRGFWRFVTKDRDDPGFEKEFPIGGENGARREVSAPFARFTTGCIAVFDQENFQHIEQLEVLAFHYGTLLKELQNR